MAVRPRHRLGHVGAAQPVGAAQVEQPAKVGVGGSRGGSLVSWILKFCLMCSCHPGGAGWQGWGGVAAVGEAGRVETWATGRQQLQTQAHQNNALQQAAAHSAAPRKHRAAPQRSPASHDTEARHASKASALRTQPPAHRCCSSPWREMRVCTTRMMSRTRTCWDGIWDALSTIWSAFLGVSTGCWQHLQPRFPTAAPACAHRAAPLVLEKGGGALQGVGEARVER